MAATHNFLTENELLDPDRLDEAEKAARKTLSEKREALKTVEAALAAKKELRKAANDYRRTRPVIDAHKKLKGKKADSFYQANEADFIIYEAALRRLKELVPEKKLPAVSKLNTEIEALISEKNALYNEYREAKAAHERLFTAQQNAQKLYRTRQQTQRKQHGQEL